jgi:hypothetical protein
VITEWTSLTPPQLREIMMADTPTEVFVGFKPRLTFVVNGLSWPATERFAYDLGTPVRWRVINLSSQAHPMHLHGFYFDVDSVGDGWRDSPRDDLHRRRVVTQLLPSGGTMAMTWVPERPGNWLFHCHIMHHVSMERRLGADEANANHGAIDHSGHHGGDMSLGMAGMVVGVTVRDPGAAPARAANHTSPRRLTLLCSGCPGAAARFRQPDSS